MGEMRRPIHLGIAVGVSASVYAVSLAAVTGLQSAQNAQIAADFAPAAAAVDRLDAVDSDLEARLEAASAAFDDSASAFSTVADQVPALEARLKDLAGTVSQIQGTSISIPSGGALPRVPKAGGVVAKPPVHTTTSASGH
jgi:hypothetical protein